MIQMVELLDERIGDFAPTELAVADLRKRKFFLSAIHDRSGSIAACCCHFSSSVRA
jgi:hypothetical protein